MKNETQLQWAIKVKRQQSPGAKIVESIMVSIDRVAKILGHRPYYCCLVQSEWDDLVLYHCGGQWFGDFEIKGVPILPPDRWITAENYVRRALR
jgi:hypothetical protein